MEPRHLLRGSFFPCVTYTIHLRVHTDLLAVARVIRLLKRHAVTAAEVAIERFSGREVASVRGRLPLGHRADGLAAALLRAPDVQHAIILSDSDVIVEFSR
ncbi:hypothetical protein BWI17_06775 [Betaproteobacteria bacterium GR16-43]|nr:hypothetical protein BWI17_06775 [Betaproteobacteria bacterium GR16-43]